MGKLYCCVQVLILVIIITDIIKFQNKTIDHPNILALLCVETDTTSVILITNSVNGWNLHFILFDNEDKVKKKESCRCLHASTILQNIHLINYNHAHDSSCQALAFNITIAYSPWPKASQCISNSVCRTLVFKYVAIHVETQSMCFWKTLVCPRFLLIEIWWDQLQCELEHVDFGLQSSCKGVNITKCDVPTKIKFSFCVRVLSLLRWV